MTKTPPLEIEIKRRPGGVLASVTAGDSAISSHQRSVFISGEAGEFTEATISYGHVNITGRIRTEKLHEVPPPQIPQAVAGIMLTLSVEELSRLIANAADALHENRPAHEQVTNARRALGCEVMSK